MREVSKHSAAPEEGRILRKKALCVPEGVMGDAPARTPLQGRPGIRSDRPLPEPEPHEGPGLQLCPCGPPRQSGA